jgi:hypothetical protein
VTHWHLWGGVDWCWRADRHPCKQVSAAVIDEDEEDTDHAAGFSPADAKAALLGGAKASDAAQSRVAPTKSFCQRRIHSAVNAEPILPVHAQASR